MSHPRDYVHPYNIRCAIRYAEQAIEHARATDRRLDCLTDALASLRGALRCVEWEDSMVEAVKACCCREGGPGSYEGPMRECPIHGDGK